MLDWRASLAPRRPGVARSPMRRVLLVTGVAAIYRIPLTS